MPPPSLHAISPALFFLVPLFILFISIQPTHRPAGPLLAQLLLTLLAAFAILAATLGLAALPKAEAVVESLFVLTLESSTVYIIYSLSSYRLYVNSLILLLSCATLLSFLSALLPHTVPSAISSALLIVFSLVSFPLLSYVIFPPRAAASTVRCLTPTSSQLFLNVPRDSRHITTSLGPSSIPFPSHSPTTSSTTIGALSTVIAPEGREDNFCDVDLEISPPAKNASTSTYGNRSPSKFLGLLFIAQFLFLLSYVLNLCSLLSTSDQLWALRTAQTTSLVISSFFTTFSYSQYVRSFLCVHDRVPGQATDSCDFSNSPTPFAKRVYNNINSTNDATHSLSKLNSLSTYKSPAQYSLSPSASMRFPLARTEVSRASSSFALGSHHVTPSGASQTLHVNDQESSKVTAPSRYPDPTTDAAPLWIRTDRQIVHRIDTHRAGNANVSAKDDANEIYMPTPIRISAPSLLFPDDMGAATLDLPENVPRPPTSDIGSALVGTHWHGRGKKTPTLVHRDSTWSISSLPSAASVPIVRTLSSSSSLALSGLYIKPRSKKSMSSMSSRQLPLLAKCVPLDVLSRNMEIAENSALRQGAERVGDPAQDRRDRQALLRVDNSIGSRSRSISAASSMTVYEDLEWVASRLDTGKEKKRSGFLFGKAQEGREYKSQERNLGQVDGPRSSRQHHQDDPQTSRIMSFGRAVRRRSLSISLLSSLMGRQKEEEVAEPISPSSSISLSTSSLLSSLSMSLTRSPTSPVSHFSLKTPADSEPGSPNESGKKKSGYYWVPRKPKKDKGKKSRSASDLQQGRDKGQDQDQEQIGLMVDGPADFMDLRDPFAPPDLGTRGYSTRMMSSDHIDGAWSDSRSPSRYGFHGTTSPTISLWGGLPLVVDPSWAPGERREAVVKSKVKTRRSRCATQSPSPTLQYQHYPGPTEATAAGRGYRQGRGRRARSDCSPLASNEQLARLRSGSSLGMSLGVEADAVEAEMGNGADDEELDKSSASPARSTVSCPEGLDIEAALLAQKLLMRLDLASPPSTMSL